MLQRIYGIAFDDKDKLKIIYIAWKKQKERSSKIRKELELFSLHEEGPGFLSTPKNGGYQRPLDAWRKEHVKRGIRK